MPYVAIYIAIEFYTFGDRGVTVDHASILMEDRLCKSLTLYQRLKEKTNIHFLHVTY